MNSSVKLLADQHLFLLEMCLPAEVELTTYDPNQGIPDDADEFDALFVRTVNPINSSTIPSRPKKLKFIASATAGIDHVDTGYLEKQNIHFRYAAGCNARSVAEYVATAMLLWFANTELDPDDLKVGIIGVGHAGGAVADLLENLGIPYLAYDPPKQQRDDEFNSCTLDELLQCDILTFHTPLTDTGQHATLHWLDESILKNHSFELIVNTARGGVIHEKSLYNAYQRETVNYYILDVWENEPIFNDLLANKSFIKTPHIAGYSQQAKWRASSQVSVALADFYDLEAPEPHFPANQAGKPSIPFPGEEDLSIMQLLKKLHPIMEYDKRFGSLISLQPGKKSIAFQKLRTGLNLRHEFSFIDLPQELLDKYPLFRKLGFGNSERLK